MISATGDSPVVRMLGPEMRSRLDLLKEQPAKRTFDDSGKFAVGDPVMARDYRSTGEKWIPGKVMRKCGTRICDVKVPNGVWRRHCEQMRRVAT